MKPTDHIPLDEWGGSPPREVARAPTKPWTTQVTYCELETGDIIISKNPFEHWTPIKKEVHVYDTKQWRIREILYLCERTKQGKLSFRE